MSVNNRSKKYDSKNGCWFTRCGFHVVLAAAISTAIAAVGGWTIAHKISKAQLIKSLVPELVSNDPKKKKIALYAVEIGISEGVAIHVAGLIGEEYKNDILGNIFLGNLDASKNNLDIAAYISPLVYDNVILGLKEYKYEYGKDSSEIDKLLVYQPKTLLFIGEDANTDSGVQFMHEDSSEHNSGILINPDGSLGKSPVNLIDPNNDSKDSKKPMLPSSSSSVFGCSLIFSGR